MPRVLNKRTDAIPPDAVYVGRPSKWGNPYRAGRDGTREEVIAKHRRWVFASRPYLVMQAQRELRGRDLVCWCAPLPCHADFWLKIANPMRIRRHRAAR